MKSDVNPMRKWNYRAELFPDPELKPIFKRWEKYLLAILDDVREAK